MNLDDLLSHLYEIGAIIQAITQLEDVERMAADAETPGTTVAEGLAYHLERTVTETVSEVFRCDDLQSDDKESVYAQFCFVDAVTHSLAELGAYIQNDLTERGRFFSLALIARRYLAETETLLLKIAA